MRKIIGLVRIIIVAAAVFIISPAAAFAMEVPDENAVDPAAAARLMQEAQAAQAAQLEQLAQLAQAAQALQALQAAQVQQALAEQQAQQAAELQARQAAELKAQQEAQARAQAAQLQAAKAAQEEAAKALKEAQELQAQQAALAAATPPLVPGEASPAEAGKTYVDVNLGAQTLTYFVNGSPVLSTPCVTGSPGRSTPTGVFAINSLVPGKYLTGPTWHVWVNRWMRFCGNVGIHDASWRKSFGGNIYRTNGSHGCVNIPRSAADQLYGMVSLGTMVIVH